MTTRRIEASIGRQYSNGSRYCSDLTADVVAHLYDEAITGVQVVGRDGLEEAMRMVRAREVDLFVVDDLDRLGRQLEDLHALHEVMEDHDVALHDAKGVVYDAPRVALGGWHAEEERTTTARRMMDGRAAALRRGKILQKAVFGYVRDYGTGQFVPHPEHHRVLMRILQGLRDGKSPSDIARALTGKHPTPQDCQRIIKGEVVGKYEPWTSRMVRRIGRNEVYAGLNLAGRTRSEHDSLDYRKVSQIPVALDDQWAVGVDDARLMDASEYERVQAATHSPLVGIPSTTRLKRLLLHRSACAGCGEALRSTAAYGTSYYACTSKGCAGIMPVPVALVERTILDALADRAEGLVEGAPDQPNPRAGRREALKAEGERLRSKLVHEMKRALAGRGVDRRDVERRRSLQARLDEVASELAEELRHAEPRPFRPDEALGSTLRDLPTPVDRFDPAVEAVVAAPLLLLKRVDVAMKEEDWEVRLWWTKPGEPAAGRAFRLEPERRDPDVVIALPSMAERVRRATARAYEEAARDRDRAADDALLARVGPRLAGAPREGGRRLAAVADCLTGGNLAQVADRHGADPRHVLAWLHLARTAGVDALLEQTAESDFDGLAVETLCRDAEVSTRGLNWNSTRRKRLPHLVALMRGQTVEDLHRRPNATIFILVTLLVRLERFGLDAALRGRFHAARLEERHMPTVERLLASGRDPADPDRPLNTLVIARVIKEETGDDIHYKSLRQQLRKRGLSVLDAKNRPMSRAWEHCARVVDILRKASPRAAE